MIARLIVFRVLKNNSINILQIMQIGVEYIINFKFFYLHYITYVSIIVKSLLI